MDLWGLVGYECFGQVVLSHGLSETFNVNDPGFRHDQIRGIEAMLKVNLRYFNFDI